jgi:GTPase SAR1 family protein
MINYSSDKEVILKEISELIATFSRRIELLSKQNENSINILAETIFSKILNALFDCDLININYSKKINNPAVDLIDNKKRIAFQVTATATNQKISDTLELILQHKLYENIDYLYFFFTTKKNKLTVTSTINELIRQISELSDLEFKYENNIIFFDDIYAILKKHDDYSKYNKIKEILNTELESLSTYLNRIKIAENPIYITFSDEIIDFGAKIIEGLLQHKFVIYHDVISLNFLTQFSKFKDQLFLATGIPHSIKTCIVIFSNNYFKDKWRINSPNRILKSAIDLKADIIPYCISNHSILIPASISLSLTYNVVRVKEQEFQVVIDDLIKKLSINAEIEESPKLFRKFARVVKKAYPTHNSSLLIENKALGMEIHECKDPHFDRSKYFICFHHNAKIEKCYEFIKGNHANVLVNSNFMILLPRERNIKNSKRNEMIEKIFGTNKWRLLEEFLLEFTPNTSRTEHRPFNIVDYIEPEIFDENNDRINFTWFNNWFNVEYKPVLVIKGLGGVGKTTLVQKLADDFVQAKPNSIVIYIDSKDILEELREIHDNKHTLDPYIFYEATLLKLRKGGVETGSNLDNEVFKMNLDSGNILMIIDGLDEVIANVPHFDVVAFLKSIYDYSEDLGKGKILLTCRDYFWKPTMFEDSTQFEFNVIQIQPFDEKLAERFFQKRHSSNSRRVTKSLQLAKIFIDGTNEGKTNKYIPFVLCIIDTILDNSEEFEDIENYNFESVYLSPSSKTDLITLNICAREKSRIGQVEVDDQVRLFVDFAVSNYASSKPRMSDEDFNELLGSMDKFYTGSAKNSLKAHPLLTISDNSEISFRYDFLAEYFKSIYVSYYLTSYPAEQKFDDKLIKILSTYAKLNNGFIREIYQRIKKRSENVESNLIDLIAEISLYDEFNASEEQKEKAISGLLAIAITIKNKLAKPDVEKNTELLKKYFADKNGDLFDVYISDFNAYDSGMKTTFDFRDINLINSKFDNYEYFWECKFNEKTMFKNSVFKNIKPPKSKELSYSLTVKNFQNCRMDELMKELIMINSGIKTDTHISAEKDIKNLLSLFIWGGQTHAVSIKSQLVHNYSGLLIGLKAILQILEDLKIIQYPDVKNNNLDKVIISRQYEYEIKNFAQQSLKSKKVLELIRKTKEFHLESLRD